MNVSKLEKYTPEIADQVRQLLIQLSRSGKDRGEIPKEWFELKYDEFLENLVTLSSASCYGFKAEELKEKEGLKEFLGF